MLKLIESFSDRGDYNEKNNCLVSYSYDVY